MEAAVRPEAGKRPTLRRALRNLRATPWLLRRCFPPSTLAAIDAGIGDRYHPVIGTLMAEGNKR